MSGYALKDLTMAHLLVRNEEWAAGIDRIHPEAFPRMATVPQRPKVLWIGCADSRVPESVVTASVPGDIFVHRNIANQFSADDRNAASVVQYAVQHLRVSHVLIVGHSHCGGVEAALEAVKSGRPPSGPIGEWLHHLIHLAKHYPEITELTEVNVISAVNRVGNFIEKMECLDPSVGEEAARVTVVGMVYELETGRLREAGRREVWPPRDEADQNGPIAYKRGVHEHGKYENVLHANVNGVDEDRAHRAYANNMATYV